MKPIVPTVTGLLLVAMFCVLYLGGTRSGAGPAVVATPRMLRTTVDGASMALVPAGDFSMGLSSQQAAAAFSELQRMVGGVEPAWFEYGRPSRKVWLPAFYIDVYEVTNDRFARFVQATAHVTRAERLGKGWVWNERARHWRPVPAASWRHPQGKGSDIEHKGSHPVVQVDWEDARAYATWAGKRLPSEAEWEKAARGPHGRLYPWGDHWRPVTNFRSGGTHAVGSHAEDRSPCGAMDMAGNVSEWTTAPNAGGPGYAPPPDLRGDRFHMVRGASWDCFPANLRCPCVLGTPVAYTQYIGFRCVMDPPGPRGGP